MAGYSADSATRASASSTTLARIREIAAPCPRCSGPTATPAMPDIGTLRPPNHCPIGIWIKPPAMREPRHARRTLSCPARVSHAGTVSTSTLNAQLRIAE